MNITNEINEQEMVNLTQSKPEVKHKRIAHTYSTRLFLTALHRHGALTKSQFDLVEPLGYTDKQSVMKLVRRLEEANIITIERNLPAPCTYKITNDVEILERYKHLFDYVK